MRLPYGRRLAAYWRPSWHRPALAVWAGCWLFWLGPLRVFLYTRRMDWRDLDAKIEREHQRRRVG